jgi:hypothetical protein
MNLRFRFARPRLFLLSPPGRIIPDLVCTLRKRLNHLDDRVQLRS